MSEKKSGTKKSGTKNDKSDKSDDEFEKGDEVSWKSHGGTGEGVVEKKITSDTHAAKRQVRADPEHPQYLVKSEKSGGEAVHKGEALTHEDD